MTLNQYSAVIRCIQVPSSLVMARHLPETSWGHEKRKIMVTSDQALRNYMLFLLGFMSGVSGGEGSRHVNVGDWGIFSTHPPCQHVPLKSLQVHECQECRRSHDNNVVFWEGHWGGTPYIWEKLLRNPSQLYQGQFGYPHGWVYPHCDPSSIGWWQGYATLTPRIHCWGSNAPAVDL